MRFWTKDGVVIHYCARRLRGRGSSSGNNIYNVVSILSWKDTTTGCRYQDLKILIRAITHQYLPHLDTKADIRLYFGRAGIDKPGCAGRYRILSVGPALGGWATKLRQDPFAGVEFMDWLRSKRPQLLARMRRRLAGNV
jgi:hypothetical protein